MYDIVNSLLIALNNIGKVFFNYATGIFVQTAILVVVLFIIDMLLKKRVRAVFRYCIWLLVLVKLILPPTLSLPTGIYYWAPDNLSVTLPSSEQTFEFEIVEKKSISEYIESPDILTSKSSIESTPLTINSEQDLIPITWQAIIFVLWVFGVLAFLLILIQRLKFVRGLVSRSNPASDDLLALLQEFSLQINIKQKIQLRLSDAVSSPAVCGLINPVILMPVNLVNNLSHVGLRSTLIHELAHIKRLDLWINFVQTVLQIIYFYNPFVWYANSVIRRVCEEAVDETVLVALDGQIDDYSNTLIDIGEKALWKSDLGLRLIGVAESKKALQWRIKQMLSKPIPKNAKLGILSIIALLLIAVVLLPMAKAERSNQPVTSGAGEMAPAMTVGDEIIDPNTGVKFVLAKTFSGANNVIKFTNKLNLSPDARFLVSITGRVVPLDGTAPFLYTEHMEDVRDAAVSPTGRYIAHGEKTIWLQLVSKDTMRPDGPARKLIDLAEGQLLGRNNGKGLFWTQDSQTVFFWANDANDQLRRHAFSAASGTPVSFPDAVSAGLLSPDGTCVALTTSLGVWLIKPIGDGAIRTLCNARPSPLCWSEDGKWLIGALLNGGARLVRYPEGQEYRVSLPKELAHEIDDYSGTSCVGSSADGSRLFFYQTGYEVKWRIKVASAEGSTLLNLDSDVRYAFRPFQWTQDGKATFQTDYKVYNMQPETALLMTPLSGAEPVQFVLTPAVSAEATPLAVSPDSKWLLFTASQKSDSNTLDLNVVPLSMADNKVSAPATTILHIASLAQVNRNALVWSPDSARVALTCQADPEDEQDIWVVFRDGKTPIRLTRTASIESDLKWSQEGNMLACVCYDGSARELTVIPTEGGDAVVIRKWTDADAPAWGWSPDGKSLTIAEEDMLMRQPLSSDKAEPIVSLKELGIERMEWLAWSPDGSRLALAYGERNTGDLLASWGQLLFARVEGGRLQQIAKERLNGGILFYAWSPDSTHVAYLCEDTVPVRPEGRLYEVVVDNIVERIKAGAIAPVQPRATESTAAGNAP
ncbi:MAG: hypothetical protein JW787_07885 [Sedimentisphaerales bacterium]|nr:hypothetical protein [Sedimentisphaerales bacterium]